MVPFANQRNRPPSTRVFDDWPRACSHLLDLLYRRNHGLLDVASKAVLPPTVFFPDDPAPTSMRPSARLASSSKRRKASSADLADVDVVQPGGLGFARAGNW